MNLLNGRPYVQGTQLLDLAARATGRDDALLESARFLRITDRIVMLAERHGDRATSVPGLLGSAAFLLKGSRVEYDFIETEDLAPRLECAEQKYANRLDHDCALRGSFEATDLPDLQALLESMVQGLKQMHQGLPSGATDVWFTGLRGFALPVDLGPISCCMFDIRPLRRLVSGNRIQTFSDVRMHCEHGQWRGQVSFAFSVHGECDVD